MADPILHVSCHSQATEIWRYRFRSVDRTDTRHSRSWAVPTLRWRRGGPDLRHWRHPRGSRGLGRRCSAGCPSLTADDTVVFLGDYIDRGPDSAGVVAWVRELTRRRPHAKIVCLRGNHEDAWLQVVEEGWPEFVMPRGNGCLECYRSFKGLPYPERRRDPDRTKSSRRCSTGGSSRPTSSSG